MTIYTKSKGRTKINYRKIYVENYGSIPIEPNGRSYEIHHIDGDCHNNDPTNLVALTLQEHYDKHYDQGDWYACKEILKKLRYSPEEISNLARKCQTDRLSAGTHNFMTRPDGTNLALDRVKKGTHPWQRRPDGTSLQQDKVNAGTHHMLVRADGSSRSGDLVKEGNHPWQRRTDGTSQSQDQIIAGTHNFMTRPDGTNLAQDKAKNGTHNFQNPKEWTCETCGVVGKNTANYNKYHKGGKCQLPISSDDLTQKQWVCDNCGKRGKGVCGFHRWHHPDSKWSCYHK